jgi:hypothetical protein
LIDAEVDSSSSAGTIGIGIAPQGSPFGFENEATIAPSGRTHLRRTVYLPAATTAAVFRTYSAGGANVTVLQADARDACGERAYERVREIESGLWLYRNPHAMPRAFTVENVTPVTSLEEARQILHDVPDFDPRRTALVMGSVPTSLQQGALEDVRFMGSRFEATVLGPTFLVVNDRYDPSFRATIDNVDAPIVRANGLVRGLFVPAGRHRVTMRYVAPRAVWVGVALALLGIAFALIVVPRYCRSANTERL